MPMNLSMEAATKVNQVPNQKLLIRSLTIDWCDCLQFYDETNDQVYGRMRGWGGGYLKDELWWADVSCVWETAGRFLDSKYSQRKSISLAAVSTSDSISNFARIPSAATSIDCIVLSHWFIQRNRVRDAPSAVIGLEMQEAFERRGHTGLGQVNGVSAAILETPRLSVNHSTPSPNKVERPSDLRG